MHARFHLKRFLRKVEIRSSRNRQQNSVGVIELSIASGPDENSAVGTKSFL